jgi:hypothetical protein
MLRWRRTMLEPSTLWLVIDYHDPLVLPPQFNVAGAHERMQVPADRVAFEHEHLVAYLRGEVTSAVGLLFVRSLTWSTAPLEGVPRIDARHLPASKFS